MASRPKYSWRLAAAAPPREVFAVMEQMCGVPPYRFRVLGPNQAEVIEVERKHFLFGHWSRRVRRPRWVRCTVDQGEDSLEVRVEASAGRAPRSRALQLVRLLMVGLRDKRTVYRDRTIPPGPVTLVASWAGMLYPIFLEPRFDSPRGQPIHTASRVEAIGMQGPFFIKVRLADGTEGYVERDQIVAAPTEATRIAQMRAAEFV